MPKGLRKFAKNLRNEPTEVERLLWNRLKSRQVEGVKFRRQQPLAGYIVDFISFEKKIAIELDGSQHFGASVKDTARDACLTKNGYSVLRFWNNDVLTNMEGVLEVIRSFCLRSPIS